MSDTSRGYSIPQVGSIHVGYLPERHQQAIYVVRDGEVRTVAYIRENNAGDDDVPIGVGRTMNHHDTARAIDLALSPLTERLRDLDKRLPKLRRDMHTASELEALRQEKEELREQAEWARTRFSPPPRLDPDADWQSIQAEATRQAQALSVLMDMPCPRSRAEWMDAFGLTTTAGVLSHDIERAMRKHTQGEDGGHADYRKGDG